MEVDVADSGPVLALLPPARFAALLASRRTEEGVALVDMAKRSAGMFSPTYLENVERGRVTLDDRVVEHLVGLYELDAGPIIPQRSELVLDLDRQQMHVGDRAMSFDSLHLDDVLERYVALISLLRGVDTGTDLVLRDADLAVLGSSLGRTEVQLRRDLAALIDGPAIAERTSRWRNAKVVAAAGLLVGATAVGTLVLVRAADGETTADRVASGTQVQGLAATTFATQVGQAAEASLSLDIRAMLPGWSFEYAGQNDQALGMTNSAENRITVFVAPTDNPSSVAEVLMHEVGHALDLDRLDDGQRAEWIAMRAMPPTWWADDGTSDFAVGAGDFAEAVSYLTTGSPSNSLYGDFTDEQLAFVEAILADS